MEKLQEGGTIPTAIFMLFYIWKHNMEKNMIKSKVQK